MREGVVKATKGRQTPWEWSSLIGDFSFGPQAASNSEAVMWGLVEQSNRAEDVTTFLVRRIPAGNLRLRRAKLRSYNNWQRSSARRRKTGWLSRNVSVANARRLRHDSG